MRCICTNLAGSEVKLNVLTPLNFLTLLSFSVTSPSCKPRSHHCRLIYHPRNRSLVIIRFRHTRRSIVAATDPAQTVCLWKRVMSYTTDTRELKGKEDGKNVFDRKHNDGVSDIRTALAADSLTAGRTGRLSQPGVY